MAISATGSAQYPPGGSGISPAERALMWQLGTRRFNDGYFQRQLFAVESQSRNERQRNQQMLRQQYGAQSRAQADRQRIRETMSPSRGRYGADASRGGRTPSKPEDDDLDDNTKTDVLLVWDEIGAGFDDADPKLIKAASTKYSAGLVVLAIRVDGMAEVATWKKNDILVGLNGYQTKTYSDLAYILEQPDLPRDKPIAALLIRDGKLFTSELTFTKVEAKAPAPVAKDLTAKDPISPASSVGPKGDSVRNSSIAPLPPLQKPPADSSAAPSDSDRRSASGRRLTAPPKVQESLAPAKPVTSTPAPAPTTERALMTDEEKLAWDIVGIRIKPVAGSLPDKRFRGGVKIGDIRPSSPAKKANWEINDVLVGLEDYQVGAIDDVLYIVAQPDRKTAKSADFRILRGKDVLTGKIDLPAP